MLTGHSLDLDRLRPRPSQMEIFCFPATIRLLPMTRTFLLISQKVYQKILSHPTSHKTRVVPCPSERMTSPKADSSETFLLTFLRVTHK